METTAPDAVDAQLAKRRSIVRSIVGAAVALFISLLIGVLWRARGWPHRLDASFAGFFFTMAIVQGVFLPTRRRRGSTVLFAFATATAAWVALHFLNAELLAARSPGGRVLIPSNSTG